MADTSAEDAAAARAQEQARIRKERREAKIKAGGSARLDKIMGLNSTGYKRDPLPSFDAPSETTSKAPTPAASKPSATEPAHADPEEVDISEHFYAPNSTARPRATPPNDPANLSEAQLRQMMLGFDRPGATPPPNPFGMPGLGGPPGAGAEGDMEDPMMKMLQQMMGGGGPGGPGGPGGNGGFPDLSSMFGGAGGNPFAPGGQMPAQEQPVDKTKQFWRGIHFLVAVLLGLYIGLLTPFTGTLAAREQSALEANLNINPVDEDAFKKYFFWAFGTAETVLLSTRYFLDSKKGDQPVGMVKMALGFVPQPYRGYLEVGMRYLGIAAALRNDVLVCIFVMGVAAWAKGARVA